MLQPGKLRAEACAWVVYAQMLVNDGKDFLGGHTAAGVRKSPNHGLLDRSLGNYLFATTANQPPKNRALYVSLFGDDMVLNAGDLSC